MPSAWGNLFSSLGQSMDDIRARKMQEYLMGQQEKARQEEMAFRKQQQADLMARFGEEQQLQKRGQQLQEAGIARSMTSPGDLSPEQTAKLAELFKGTPYEAGLEKFAQPTLPSTQFGPAGMRTESPSMGGRLRPSLQEESAQQNLSLQKQIADMQQKLGTKQLGELGGREKLDLEQKFALERIDREVAGRLREIQAQIAKPMKDDPASLLKILETTFTPPAAIQYGPPEGMARWEAQMPMVRDMVIKLLRTKHPELLEGVTNDKGGGKCPDGQPRTPLGGCPAPKTEDKPGAPGMMSRFLSWMGSAPEGSTGSTGTEY